MTVCGGMLTVFWTLSLRRTEMPSFIFRLIARFESRHRIGRQFDVTHGSF